MWAFVRDYPEIFTLCTIGLGWVMADMLRELQKRTRRPR